MDKTLENVPAATDPNAALGALLCKWGVQTPRPWRLLDGPSPAGDQNDALRLLDGHSLLAGELDDSTVPLQPWRSERRLVELKGLVDRRTIDPVLMCRLACLTDGEAMPLGAILYRQFDLAEWLVGSTITHMYACVCRERSANLIVHLDNGVVCSLEAATTLPRGAAMQDRHELIARRGVASDRVVDTQVAQSSVYAFGSSGVAQYTDTDAELFGLTAQQVALVRSAYTVLHEPDEQARSRRRHGRLVKLVRLTWESDRRRQRLAVEGVRS